MDSEKLVYLKRWRRRWDCLVFWLSNRVVQAVWLDERAEAATAELIIDKVHTASVQYRLPSGEVGVLTFEQAQQSTTCDEEVISRLKFVKRILMNKVTK